MIIDAHAHVIGKAEMALAPRVGGRLVDSSSAQDLLRAMDAVSVTGAVVVGLRGDALSDQAMSEALKLAPHRFRALLVHDPVSGIASELGRIARVGAVGLRFLGLELGVERIFAELAARNLVASIYPRHGEVPHLLRLLATYPSMTMVLNHLGMPWDGPRLIGADLRRYLEPLADIDNLSIMLSGQWAFSTAGYPYVDLQRTVRDIIGMFGHTRILWASDFPWPTLTSGYAHELDQCRDQLACLGVAASDSILGRNAAAIYGFRPSLIPPQLDCLGDE